MCGDWKPRKPGESGISVFCDLPNGHKGDHEHRAMHNVTGEFIVISRWPNDNQVKE